MDDSTYPHDPPDMFLEFVANVGSAKWAGLGLIPWTAFATHLHLYGRVRVGLRFCKTFPFIDRISISFVSEPQVSLAINVMGMGLSKGFDAGTLPLVASYVDATLKRALKGSLVAVSILPPPLCPLPCVLCLYRRFLLPHTLPSNGSRTSW